MAPRKPPETKPKIDWAAASFVLAITIAILAAIQAYNTFNSSISQDVAVLKQQVADLREAERERRRNRHERDR